MEEQAIQTNTVETNKKIPTKFLVRIGIGGIIMIITLLFIYLKYQDRQNGYYGTFTLNIEGQTISADTDDYVLNMGGDTPISVGIEILGINKKNIEKVDRFYAESFNQIPIFTISTDNIDDPQYFAIPRSGGQYLLGANIYYKDGKTIKTTNTFNQAMFTIRSANRNTPIVSLKTSKDHITLNEELEFSISTQIADPNKTNDFTQNKKILRDFDGDGKWDRSTSDTTTKYRYTQTYGLLSYTPKVAVVYNGLTGETKGNTIYIK